MLEMKVRFTFHQLLDKDLYYLQKVYSMIHTLLSLDNMYLDLQEIIQSLQELLQIPYSPHIFMHKLSRSR